MGAWTVEQLAQIGDASLTQEWRTPAGRRISELPILLPVAEYDALQAQVAHLSHERDQWIEAHDALDAEVERLKSYQDDSWKNRALSAEQRLRRITFTTNDDGDLVLISEQDEDGQILRVMWERDERLRKGRDDESRVVADRDVPLRGANLLADHALDHRLGTQQPEGEPCEPMSARSWRRRTSPP